MFTVVLSIIAKTGKQPVSFNRRTGKQIVPHPYNGFLINRNESFIKP